MSEPCKHCGEYHSCTDLIDEQAARIEHLNQFGEQMALDAFERGKAFGYAEGLKAAKLKGE
jgi:flagellar biosynthesis/type III secretory pathway protein FliH